MLPKLFLVGFILFALPQKRATAQYTLTEGTLVYRVDTVRRLERQPAAYKATQFKLYKKGDLIRVERLSINVADSTDKQLFIEIRNAKGIYTLLEMRTMPINFAQFTTYEEEKMDRAEAALQGHLPRYTLTKTGQKAVFLNRATEKIILTRSDNSDSIDAQITKSLIAPVHLFFEPFQRLDGTPLQFTESQSGWLNRYTIESITAQSLPATLFEIDPALKVMTTKEMLKELENFK
jgi:hypothetical protein